MKSIAILVLICAQMSTTALTTHLTSSAKPDSQDALLTAAEKIEVRNFAKRFTKRLYEVKDLNPLVNEFFVPNFAENLMSVDATEGTFYTKLTRDERQRLYVVTLNMMFYSSLSIINSHNAGDNSLGKLFSPRIAKKLTALENNPLLDDESKQTDVVKLRAYLAEMERAVASARDHLRHLSPEKTLVLTREVVAWNEDTAYSMKEYWSDNFPAESKATQVFLPFLLDIVVVKVDGQWKVWAMFPDGD